MGIICLLRRPWFCIHEIQICWTPKSVSTAISCYIHGWKYQGQYHTCERSQVIGSYSLEVLRSPIAWQASNMCKYNEITSVKSNQFSLIYGIWSYSSHTMYCTQWGPPRSVQVLRTLFSDHESLGSTERRVRMVDFIVDVLFCRYGQCFVTVFEQWSNLSS